MALLKNKWVIIGVIVVIILTAVYFVGRGDGTTKIDTVPLPGDQNWGESLNDSESKKVREITLRLYAEMKGLNFSYDKNLYREVGALTDELFVALYNDFNQMYADEGKGTLRAWIASEGGGFSFASSSFAEIQAGIINRMNALNLQ